MCCSHHGLCHLVFYYLCLVLNWALCHYVGLLFIHEGYKINLISCETYKYLATYLLLSHEQLESCDIINYIKLNKNTGLSVWLFTCFALTKSLREFDKTRDMLYLSWNTNTTCKIWWDIFCSNGASLRQRSEQTDSCLKVSAMHCTSVVRYPVAVQRSLTNNWVHLNDWDLERYRDRCLTTVDLVYVLLDPFHGTCGS